MAICANIAQGAGFGFLAAWVGLAMCAVAIIRDGINTQINKRRPETDRNRITRLDLILMFFWLATLTVATYFTATGFLSWFGFFGTAAFTIGICLKNVLVYRICGVINFTCWVVYNIYVENLMGVILKGTVLMASLIGLGLYVNKHLRTRAKVL